MSKCIKLFSWSLIFLGFVFKAYTSHAQTKEELERKRKEKEKEIAFTKKLIDETSEKQKETVNYLQVLNEQINARESLIETISEELIFINKNIDENQEVIAALERDLEALRDEYEKMVEFAFKTRSAYNKLSFIFSAEDFNQAFKRLKFLQYYSRYRERQIELIDQTKESLQGKISVLQRQREAKRKLLQKEKKAKQEIEEDKKAKAGLVAKLEKKEKQLRQEVKEKEKIARDLSNAISAIIKREMEAARKREEESGSDMALTPEAKLLSGEFEKNRNRLPWPVQKGFISGRFGDHPHPTLKGVVVSNKGIDIRTNKNATARAVFDGEVRGVANIRGAGLAVIIKHGEYFSVYSNLEDVYVKPKQKIEAREEIGKIRTNPATGETEVHLEIWKNAEMMDPEKWLSRKS